jgi:hypothetical protein
MDEDKEERRGFRVTDRRRFSDTGETRPQTAGEPAEPAAAAEPAPPSAPERAAIAQPLEDEAVTFSTFVLGLSTQVLLHLGEIANPVTGAVERDLQAAKQVIDILGILAEKTRNNLEAGEQALLESILYDLRMRYVELVQRGVKEAT